MVDIILINLGSAYSCFAYKPKRLLTNGFNSFSTK